MSERSNMASRGHTEICEILDENGPDLLQRIQLSEMFYQYLISEKVVQDNTLITDLKVMKPTEQTSWILGHVRRGNAERYRGFIRTLILTGQEDLVNEILKEAPVDYIAASSNLNDKEPCKFETLKQHYQNSLGKSPLFEYATRSPLFQIEDVFTKLHLIHNEMDAMSHKMTAFKKEREHPSISLSEIFRTEDKSMSVIIEGKAGSGKTTLLKHCCIVWAKNKLISPIKNNDIYKSENLPFFQKDLVLFVNKLHEGEDLDETIANAMKGSVFEKKEAVTLVRQHPEKCFLFIDALDEFCNEQVRKEIFDLTADGRTNILVSCREGHPYLNNKMENFSRHVKVAGFRPADAYKFIQRFMKSLIPNEIYQEKTDKICSCLKKAKVRNLYLSPINCTFVCIAFLEGHVTDEDLDTLTITRLFEIQETMILRRECRKQVGSSENIDQCLIDAMHAAERIYQLALTTTIVNDQGLIFSKEYLEEFGIDLKSPAMVLLVKETYVSSECEDEVYSWPHEKIKEFHAAKAAKNDIALIYYIASRPEHDEVRQFLVSLLANSNLVLTKMLLMATFILQSVEPPCAFSWIRRILGHCCTKIPKLKKKLQLSGGGSPSKLIRSLDMIKVQKCTRNTGWALTNYDIVSKVADCISTCTSQDTQFELARSVLHRFLPSVLEGSSVYAIIEKEEHDMKELKLFMYPAHDGKYQMMYPRHFRLEKSKIGDGEEAGVDSTSVGGIVGDSREDDEIRARDLKGFCLLVGVDPTIQFDDYTMSYLQHLTQKVKHVDHLLLELFELDDDNNYSENDDGVDDDDDDDDEDDDKDNDREVTWEKSSVIAVENIVKPKVGLFLDVNMVRLFKDEDLYQLTEDGVRFIDTDTLRVGYVE